MSRRNPNDIDDDGPSLADIRRSEELMQTVRAQALGLVLRDPSETVTLDHPYFPILSAALAKYAYRCQSLVEVSMKEGRDGAVGAAERAEAFRQEWLKVEVLRLLLDRDTYPALDVVIHRGGARDEG